MHMNIIEMTSLLFPAGIATSIHLVKINSKSKYPILLFVNYSTIINLLNYIIIYFLFGHNGITFTVLFTIKYLLISIINAIIISFLTKLFINYIKIDVERKK